jgi:hypothetical protein
VLDGDGDLLGLLVHWSLGGKDGEGELKLLDNLIEDYSTARLSEE